MATAAQQAQAEQRRRTAALAAGGALVVGAGDGQSAAGQAPSAAARAATAATILAALVAFLTTERTRARAWLGGQLAQRQPQLAPDDITAIVNEEDARAVEFERRAARRFARDLTTALAIPDARKRDAAVEGLVQRERTYVRQREEAMAARAFAALDRVVLRVESPQGAFWKLDPTVIEHTVGCLFMGGKFWPWKVLDRVHPPRHPGCPCGLLGLAEAVADGWMRPEDVPDVAVAVRRAASVVMEGVLVLAPEDAAGLLIEAYGDAETAALRAALLSAGLTTGELFDAQLG